MNNICFLCTSPAWGGLEMNVVKLAANLNNAGENVTIYTEENTRISQVAKSKNINVRIIPTHLKYFDFISAFRISKMLKNDNIKYLFSFHSRDNELCSNIKLISQDLTLVYQQHMHVGRMKKDFLHTLRFSRFDFWISPLEMLADEVRTMTNFDKTKIRVIPLGVDETKINNKIEKLAARNLLGISDNSFVFGILGRIDAQKGQQDLVAAFEKIYLKYPNIQILIMGDKTIGSVDNYYEKIIDKIDNLKINQRIHILPSRTDVNIFYKAIDSFVLASGSETYGMVTIESMIAGVPVIATDRGGTVEILRNGEFGTLYKSGDVDDLSAKMEDVYSNYQKHLQIAAKAQQYAVSKFTAKIEVEKIQNQILI
jgi:glycosyltransferase involved in cell wall biosynthesis